MIPPPPPPGDSPRPPRIGNYFRRLSRKKVRLFPLSVLFILWGYGLYDTHLGESSEYLPDDLPVSALVGLDRDLRLGAALVDQPGFVRWMLFSEGFEQDLEDSREFLLELKHQELLDGEGEAALAAVETELGLAEPEKLTQGEKVELARQLARADASWWDVALAKRNLGDPADRGLARGLAVQAEHDLQLVRANTLASGALWILFLAGVAAIPRAFGQFRAGWNRDFPRDYASRWSPSLVLAVFLAVNLLGDYLLSGAYLATHSLDTGFLFEVSVDTLWRLIPPLLALALFFRKPRHAIRSLGLGQKPAWAIILGVMAVLQIIDMAAYALLGHLLPPDLSNQPDLMESGLRGLIYGVLSACLFAPVAEEILYRGILLRGLERRFGFALAATVATVAFALGHDYDLYGLFSVGLFGLSTALVYRATRSLSTTIALHALYNFTITLPEWLHYHAQF